MLAHLGTLLSSSRRRFIANSAQAALGLLVLPRRGHAGAQHAPAAAPPLPQSARATLSTVARCLFPHPDLPQSSYDAVAARLEHMMAASGDAATLIGEALRRIDAASGGAWLTLSDAERTRVLTELEREPFFPLLLNTSIDVIYRDPVLWKLVGYEGSAIEHGGYLHRGFNDIDWLPK